jgi:hypothetical protein
LYLYFLGLSYRNTSKALSRFVKRSHVFIWKWIPRLVIDTYGNSVTEPAAIPASDQNNDDVDIEGFPNKGDNHTGEFRTGNMLEDKLKPANSQLKDLKSKLEAYIPDDQENKFLDIQFEVPFESLRDYMRVSFSKNNHIKSIWFSAKIDVVARNVSNIQIGKEAGDIGSINH